MRRLFPSFWVVIVPLVLSGCLEIGTDSGDASSTGTTPTGTTTTTTTTGDAAAGTACGLDSTGTVQLCEEISVCPGLGVDPTVYAECGFRLGASSPIDLECVCSGTYLCPIGVANSCSDATRLLSAQDAVTVCQQVSEGRCIQLAPAEAGTATSGTCTAACRSECANVPDCLVACGC